MSYNVVIYITIGRAHLSIKLSFPLTQERNIGDMFFIITINIILLIKAYFVATILTQRGIVVTSVSETNSYLVDRIQYLGRRYYIYSGSNYKTISIG